MSRKKLTAGRVLAIIAVLFGGYLVADLADYFRESVEIYECQFKNMSGIYQTNGLQLNKQESLILVWDEDRRFMFQRYGLSSCWVLRDG